MPTQTLKKNKNASRVFTIPSVAVPVVLLKNVKKNITYKVPVNLLQPKNLLKAKLKNRANATKKAENARRERLAAQARFAAMLRNSRAKNAAAIAATAAAPTPVWLSPFVANNAGSSTRTVRRGPGARGTGAAGAGNGGLVSLPAPKTLMPSNLFSMLASRSRSANSTVRKANLLRMEHLASKAAPAPPRKPVGKFWKKEGTNNSNSSSSNNNNSD